jgi:hypothetical protein
VRIRIAIAIALTLTLIAVGISLARSPLVVAGTDGTPLPEEVGETSVPTTVCQSEETVPQGTTAIRVSLLSLLGPRLTLQAKAGGQLITSGELGYGWTGAVVAIPVRRVASTYTHVTVCIAMAKRQQLVNLRGFHTKFAPATSEGGQVLPGRLRFEYLRPDKRSWLSLARPTARLMGLTVGGGGGIVVVLLMLVMSTTALSSWLLMRNLR